MKRSLKIIALLATILNIPITHADIAETDASGIIDCHYTVSIVAPDMQATTKLHLVTTVKPSANSKHNIDITLTSGGRTEHEHFRLPIKRQNGMWEIEFPKANDNTVKKLQYDQYNGVQPWITFPGMPTVSLLNGSLQKDSSYLHFDGHCDFKPIH